MTDAAHEPGADAPGSAIPPDRLRRRRPWRAALLAVVVLVLLALVWCGRSVWQVERALSHVRSNEQTLAVALQHGHSDEAGTRLRQIAADSATAHHASGGVTWSLLGHLPVVGADLRATAHVSKVLDTLGRDGLLPLSRVSDAPAELLPHDGRVSVTALARLRGPLTRASDALSAAHGDLAAQDLSGVHGPVASRLHGLDGDVASADSSLSTATTALQVLPGMLGADGPRNYLLVVQNNAEIRSTGGLAGANLLLHTDDGKVSITRQMAGRSFLQTKQPVLPLTSAELKIYGPTLGEFYSAAGFTPDFPRAAALWKARWEQVYPDDQIDGVLAIDPVTASYLLAATGPVRIGDDTYSDIDVVAKLLAETYFKYPDPDDQDAHFQQVADGLVTRFINKPGNAYTLLQGLGRSAREGRLLFYSFLPSEQKALAGDRIEGALVDDPTAAPQVGVYLNDTTGSKMSYFLHTNVTATSTGCASGAQQLSGSAQLTSQAPTDVSTLPAAVTGGGTQGVTPGDQLVTVRIYGPVDGTVDTLVLDGKPLKGLRTIDQDGRPVASAYIELEPQQSSTLSWTMTTGAGQTGPTQMSVTPGIDPGTQSKVIATAC